MLEPPAGSPVPPLESLGLALDKQTFRDAVALKMGRDFPDPLPQICPSCDAPFDISHALKCKKGGWVRRRHDEVKDAWATLFKKVSSSVGKEPYLPSAIGMRFEKTTTTTKPDARADLLVRGLFQPLQEAYLDVAVHDTGAEGYSRLSPSQLLKDRETFKRGKYEERCRLSGTFAPLICSVYGTLAPEASKILSLVVNGLDSEDPEKAAAVSMQRVYLQIATVKATSLCLRARSRSLLPPCESFPEALEDCRLAVANTAPRAYL